MTRLRRALFALALLLAGAPVDAGQIRLVLGNGYVLPLDADGSALAGEARQLALPAEQAIHAIEPDYANRRLYVTLDGPQPHYLTRVYDLETLQLLDELDDVVAVYVPDDPAVRTFLTRRYVSTKADRYQGSTLSLIRMIGDLHWQQRDRRRPAKVLADGADDTIYPPLPRCHRGGSRPFLSADPRWRPGRRFARTATKDTGTSGDEPPLQRLILACLPGGDTLELLYERDYGIYRRFDGYPAKWIERRHGKRSVARYAIEPFVPLRDTQLETRLLGAGGRYLVVPALGLVVDTVDATIRRAGIGGEPPWMTRSADGQTLYGLPLNYVYRSIISETYTEGGSPWFVGGIDRLSVADGTPRVDKLALSTELAGILQHQDEELEAFRTRVEEATAAAGQAVESQAAEPDSAAEPEPEPAEPELTPLQQRVGRWIHIVGVLDE